MGELTAKMIDEAHDRARQELRKLGLPLPEPLGEIFDLAKQMLLIQGKRVVSHVDLHRIRKDLDDSRVVSPGDVRSLLVAYEAQTQFCEVLMAERDHARFVEAADAFEQRDAAVSLVKDLFEPSCVVCGNLLEGLVDVESTEPPHCFDCHVPDEEVIRWENETKPSLRRRIDTVKGEVAE